MFGKFHGSNGTVKQAASLGSATAGGHAGIVQPQASQAGTVKGAAANSAHYSGTSPTGGVTAGNGNNGQYGKFHGSNFGTVKEAAANVHNGVANRFVQGGAVLPNGQHIGVGTVKHAAGTLPSNVSGTSPTGGVTAGNGGNGQFGQMPGTVKQAAGSLPTATGHSGIEQPQASTAGSVGGLKGAVAAANALATWAHPHTAGSVKAAANSLNLGGGMSGIHQPQSSGTGTIAGHGGGSVKAAAAAAAAQPAPSYGSAGASSAAPNSHGVGSVKAAASSLGQGIHQPEAGHAGEISGSGPKISGMNPTGGVTAGDGSNGQFAHFGHQNYGNAAKAYSQAQIGSVKSAAAGLGKVQVTIKPMPQATHNLPALTGVHQQMLPNRSHWAHPDAGTVKAAAAAMATSASPAYKDQSRYDGQGSGHPNGPLWHPPFGYVGNSDGARGQDFDDYKQA
jgi:hypothetical protein